MAGKTITMSKLKQIIRLRGNGVSLQRISKGVGISRNTVKKYLKLIEVKGLDHDELLGMADEQLTLLLSDPDQISQERHKALKKLLPYLEKELQRTGVTRWILWGEYKQQHPDGYSYAHFCYYLRGWLDSSGATMHFEHHPGDKTYIDFAGKKLHWVDPHTGELHEVEVYVAILGFSQLTYVQAISNQKKEHFIRATENALYYFGGVTQVLVPDNLKSAVTKASKYEADLNSDFADFANHYGTSVLPARSYKPRDKALVEHAVRLVYSRVYAPLRNRVFHSLEALNHAIAELVEAHNNQPFQKLPHSRREKFEGQEKEKLMALAKNRYELKRFKSIKVMKNSHVHLSDDKHYYSVPYRYIGRKIKMIYTVSQVTIYYNKQCIAVHKRDPKHFSYTTVPEHLPSSHQFVSDWNPDKFLSWAARIDPKVKTYIYQILEAKRYPEQAYRSCVGILSQEKKVGRQRLIDAVDRAAHYGVYNYKIIDRILKGGLDRIKPDTTQDQAILPFHENIRGKHHYK
jgi:transposase